MTRLDIGSPDDAVRAIFETQCTTRCEYCGAPCISDKNHLGPCKFTHAAECSVYDKYFKKGK